MPSPFPGMDPYLEGPRFFPDLHERLIYCLSDALNGLLPESYYSGISSRVWLETPQRPVGPDVDVHRAGPGSSEDAAGVPAGVALAVVDEVLAGAIQIRVPGEELHEAFVEIYSLPEGDRLVTTIEVLSRSNKTPGDSGRNLYGRMQRELLDSRVHLVEIDLLRGGLHSTAVPLDSAPEKAGAFDYHVCTRRFDQPPGDFFVFPIRLEDRLPTVPIPLLPADRAVRVDLQALLDRAYESTQFRRRVRYAELTPTPPLRSEQSVWAQQILRSKGLLA